jgi:hypothetical protein
LKARKESRPHFFRSFCDFGLYKQGKRLRFLEDKVLCSRLEWPLDRPFGGLEGCFSVHNSDRLGDSCVVEIE